MITDSGANCLQIVEEEMREVEVGENRESIVEDYRILNIATHNINGIKGNATKLELLLEQASQEKIDIIGVNETNITEKQSKYNMNRQEEYLGIWTDAEESKKKGSGVGLIMNKKQEKHLSQVKRSNAYYIEALFIFKKQKLQIIVVYILHNDKKIRKYI